MCNARVESVEVEVEADVRSRVEGEGEVELRAAGHFMLPARSCGSPDVWCGALLDRCVRGEGE